MTVDGSEFAKRLDALAREVQPSLWLISAFDDVKPWSEAMGVLKDHAFRIELTPAAQHRETQLALHADFGWGGKAFGYYSISRGVLSYNAIRSDVNQLVKEITFESEGQFQNHLFDILADLVRKRSS